MIRVCSNCKIYMGEKEPLADSSLTHGYCSLCYTAIMKGVELRKLVELVEAE